MIPFVDSTGVGQPLPSSSLRGRDALPATCAPLHDLLPFAIHVPVPPVAAIPQKQCDTAAAGIHCRSAQGPDGLPGRAPEALLLSPTAIPQVRDIPSLDRTAQGRRMLLQGFKIMPDLSCDPGQ